MDFGFWSGRNLRFGFWGGFFLRIFLQERLVACLDSADQIQLAVEELVELLDECNAALYVMAEMEHQRRSALAGLERASPLPPYKDALVALARDL